MSDLIFEPSEKDEDFVDALIEGLDKFADKLSTTTKSEED